MWPFSLWPNRHPTSPHLDNTDFPVKLQKEFYKQFFALIVQMNFCPIYSIKKISPLQMWQKSFNNKKPIEIVLVSKFQNMKEDKYHFPPKRWILFLWSYQGHGLKKYPCEVLRDTTWKKWSLITKIVKSDYKIQGSFNSEIKAKRERKWKKVAL